jgi:GNAT superfamily N-acetyltransferase
MTSPTVVIEAAEGAADMAHVRSLFGEYQAWLGVDLCFQDFEAELKSLPGKYAPPGGRLLLARIDAEVVGGVGMWPLGEDVCEMKRLYVRPPWRRTGSGRRLAEAIVDVAAREGYARMRLDTLARLGEAMALYRSMGFVEIPAYYENPLGDVVYMERDLRTGAAQASALSPHSAV